MITCQNCGNTLSSESNFCRFCGTKFNMPQSRRARKTMISRRRGHMFGKRTNSRRRRKCVSGVAPTPSRRQAAIFQHSRWPISSRILPCRRSDARTAAALIFRGLERRISTAGWITFAVLLVLFFPLFWIGLLIKEDVRVCQVCNSRFAT